MVRLVPLTEVKRSNRVLAELPFPHETRDRGAVDLDALGDLRHLRGGAADCVQRALHRRRDWALQSQSPAMFHNHVKKECLMRTLKNPRLRLNNNLKEGISWICCGCKEEAVGGAGRPRNGGFSQSRTESSSARPSRRRASKPRSPAGQARRAQRTSETHAASVTPALVAHTLPPRFFLV